MKREALNNLKTQNSYNNDSKTSKYYEEGDINPNTVIVPFHNSQSETFNRNRETYTLNNINLTDNSDQPNFTVHEDFEIKGKTIMEAGNIVTKLESLVNELNFQIDFLQANEWNNDFIEKWNQFYKLINSQIIGTIKLKSFKYLQDSIKSEIGNDSDIIKSSISEETKSTLARCSSYASPQPSKHMQTWLSQPTYKLSARSKDWNNIFSYNNPKEEWNSSMKKVKQRLDYDSMLHEYKANIETHNNITNIMNKENSNIK